MSQRYNFSLTTFSPSGKLVQIEYALTAVQSGATSVGIKATNGVVIATEKQLPTVLIDEASLEKIVNVNKKIGLVYSGMGPDARLLSRKARKMAQGYHRVYQEHQPASQSVTDVASVMQEYTQSGGVRPFGVSLLMAGYDDEGPKLFQIDPSGSYFAWKVSLFVCLFVDVLCVCILCQGISMFYLSVWRLYVCMYARCYQEYSD